MQSNVTQVKNGCMRYAINWTDILESSDVFPVENLSRLANVSWPLEKCNDWEYDTSIVQSSIVIDVSKYLHLKYSISQFFYNLTI